MMPAYVDFSIYKGLGELPHFNDSPEVPDPVANFQRLVTEADAVFICTPEYAFGVPGSLKNALDWTVGTGSFVDKPVALVTASSMGNRAHAALLDTLTAISANVPADAALLISFIRARLNEKGEINDTATYDSLKKVVDAIVSLAMNRKSKL
ncbi:flavin reductase [Ostertagia ostertagi]